MAPRRKAESKSVTRRPATTVEGRENQLVSLAVDLAEKQLRDGTASAQVTTHYLKLGSTREQLEQDRLRQENELLKAKVENLGSMKRMEELYKDAMDAFRGYRGESDEEDDEYDVG